MSLGAAPRVPPYGDDLIWKYVCLLQVYSQINSAPVHFLSSERNTVAVCHAEQWDVCDLRVYLQVWLSVLSQTAVHSSDSMLVRSADYSG